MTSERSALIGYTGFVGGNLDRQHSFSDRYNSKDIGESAGEHYDLVVCAAVAAEKWKANQDPDADWSGIKRLMESLAKIETKKFILISTVDVYGRPIEVTEDDVPDPNESTAYGRHRYKFEQFVSDRFDTLTFRLPGLFGKGLRKNAIYDLLNENMVDQIHADSVFQFYDLKHLWNDIRIARENNLSLLNVTTEPTSMQEVAMGCLGTEFTNKPEGKNPVRYDFRSKYDKLFGGRGGYLYQKHEVLSDLAEFATNYRAKA